MSNSAARSSQAAQGAGSEPADSTERFAEMMPSSTAEPLPDYGALYAPIIPRSPLRNCALLAINALLRLRGWKLPPYFSLRSRFLFREGWMEPDLYHLLPRLLQRGMTVVDVGANVGIITRQLCRLVGPTGKVFAFEPDPFTFQFLEFNTRSFSNRQVVQSAISDNHEPAQLYLSPDGATGNSLLNPTNSSGSVSVPCISLDEFLERARGATVDVIKIDVEGAELSVLRGMRKTRARLPGLQLIVEYCPKNLQGSGVQPRALYDELKTGGCDIKAIRDDGSTRTIACFEDLEPTLNTNGYVNLLCGKGSNFARA
jgi:FkbM family methyltransferase